MATKSYSDWLKSRLLNRDLATGYIRAAKEGSYKALLKAIRRVRDARRYT